MVYPSHVWVYAFVTKFGDEKTKSNNSIFKKFSRIRIEAKECIKDFRKIFQQILLKAALLNKIPAASRGATEAVRKDTDEDHTDSYNSI